MEDIAGLISDGYRDAIDRSFLRHGAAREGFTPLHSRSRSWRRGLGFGLGFELGFELDLDPGASRRFRLRQVAPESTTVLV